MDIKDFAELIKRKRDRLDSMMRRKMPVMVGRMAKDHFQDNFRQGGFVNGGLHPWPKSKRLSSGGTDAASNYGTLLSDRKHLFKSVGYTPADYRVRVFNEVVYAPVHNWGRRNRCHRHRPHEALCMGQVLQGFGEKKESRHRAKETR
mgnify:CR=1 FL=1